MQFWVSICFWVCGLLIRFATQCPFKFFSPSPPLRSRNKGNGVDYFVPRQRTLAALQLYFKKSSSEWDFVDLEEVVILSNCARFEILVLTNNMSTMQMSNGNNSRRFAHEKAILHSLASKIALQLRAYEKRPFRNISIPLDRPDAIDMTASTFSPEIEQAATELSNFRHWTHLEGERDILEHLCLVASGMALRPRRPERTVVFRPFSSRDAHILLQLKRTLDISTKTSPKISLLLRYALQAGKTVRNANKVPEILELRQFGTGNTKFDTQPPAHLLARVAQVRPLLLHMNLQRKHQKFSLLSFTLSGSA